MNQLPGKKFSSNETGTVGTKYWRGFLMQQNKHRLVSKRGQKYSLDYQNWTTYHKILHIVNLSLHEIFSVS